MDSKNPIYEKGYPEWKKNLWGAFRSFVAGFLSSLAVFLLTLNGETLTDVDWWIRIVLVGSLVGGLVALGKFLRDAFPENPVLARLPI